MKLNCDLGESFGAWTMGLDEAVMPHIHMANIACGFHASDPLTMDKTLRLAAEFNVEVGAHPGYPDLVGFGRRSMKCSPDEIRTLLHYQIGALSQLASAQGQTVTYVKPHGALYNDMMRDDLLMQQIMSAVAESPNPLALVIQATARNEDYLALADKTGIKLMFEAFADRGYDAEGLLLPRASEGAVFHDPSQILERVEQLISDGTIQSACGKTLDISPDTLCVHGDNAESVAQVKAIRKVIDAVSD